MIKFRAWSKLSKKMVYRKSDGWFDSNVDLPKYRDQSISLNTASLCDSIILMQSTELKDDNNKGVELFEGDIVYIAGTGNCTTKICPMFGVTFWGADDGPETYHDNLMEGDIGDIIGNIHENPELMEQS